VERFWVENFFWQKVIGKSSKSRHCRAVKSKIRGVFLTNSFEILAPLLQALAAKIVKIWQIL